MIDHWLAPEASWWSVAHAVLPAIFFSSGAWNAGCRSPSKSLLIRGALTIAAVALAFDAAHGIRELPAWAPVVSSYLIPFVVTLLDAARLALQRPLAACERPSHHGGRASRAASHVISRRCSNGMWGVPPRRWEDDAPDQLLMNQQALARLEEAILALPPNHRVVVTLRDIDGLSAEEVCNVLGISETNQRVLLHRARSRLRGVLEEYLERK